MKDLRPSVRQHVVGEGRSPGYYIRVVINEVTEFPQVRTSTITTLIPAPETRWLSYI